MSGLFSSLNASAGSLNALERALTVTENNVSNASTPGYATQSTQFTALPFDSTGNSVGGVQFSGASSARNESAEQYVQLQTTGLGTASAIANSLTTLESSFDVSGTSGIDGAFTQFFNSFSALSQNPNSDSARQGVLTSAQAVAAAFQSVASGTSQASASATQQINSTVDQINHYSSQIQQINQQIQSNTAPDPNLEATLHSDLEALSGLVNISSTFSADGTVNVSINGQIPLVVGSTAYTLRSGSATADPNAAYPQGVPAQAITDSTGRDVTYEVTGGQLGGLLQVRNSTLAGIQGDTTQPGSLNQLAQSFADRVNTLLVSGQSSSGPPVVAGIPMFQYTAGDPTNVAKSLQVTGITGDQIATIDAGPPYSANSIAQQIGNLGTATDSADQIDGVSFTSFYAQIASGVGQQISDAQTQQQQQADAVAQAQSLRSQLSGVSLDQEAVNLTAFQRSYQATSKLVTVLDSLTETTINLIR